MKQLFNLTAKSIDEAWQEPRGVAAAVHHEHITGVFLHVTLGTAGVVVRHGEEQVGIPLDEIIRLVRAHNPKIGVPDPAPAPNSQLPAPNSPR